MDLEAAADELYGTSPDDFVARRTELVAQARAAKDRALAKEIGQLRRPTRSGWLINVLAREAPEEIELLLELGAELADAQQRMAGGDLRRLSKQRRTTVDALAKKAVRLGTEHSYQAPESAVQDVSQSLQAALGDPEVAELVRRGRMTQAVTYGGFGLGGPAPSADESGGDLMAAMAASLAAAQPKPTKKSAPQAEQATPERTGAEQTGAEREESGRAEAERVAAAKAEAERAEAEQAERARRQEEFEAAERQAEEATAHADELADRVEALKTELRETETAEREAREEARAARKRLAALRPR